ncbi:MAG: hypothetical protein RLZZ568_490 [Cyanobacteriota bacterium]
MSPYQAFLSQRYRAIGGYTGLVCFIAGLGILSPLLALIFYPDEWPLAGGIVTPGLLLAIVGWTLWQGLTPPQWAQSQLTGRVGHCRAGVGVSDPSGYSALFMDIGVDLDPGIV